MSAPYNLSDETERRLNQIVEREFIGGEVPSVNLALAELQPDEDALHDSAFMAGYFSAKLAGRGSTLRVQLMERYWFEGQLSGASSNLGLHDSAIPNAPIRLFYFGLYRPGVNWHPMATGRLLEAHRQGHFDNIEKKRLRDIASAKLVNLASIIDVIVRRRLAETPPTIEESRLLGDDLGRMYDLTKLDSWAYICQIMGYNFPEILAEACLTVG